MDAIYKRRSIRRYRKEPVPRETLLAVVKAGMNAPSAGNEQPWQFLVVTERAVLDGIPRIHPYAAMLREAPAAILVCGDLSLERHEGYWVQDCSAATENMLLEIADRGLGGVWLGIHPVEERVRAFQALFALPGHVVPLCLVALGVPAEAKEPKDVFLPERVRFERWG